MAVLLLSKCLVHGMTIETLPSAKTLHTQLIYTYTYVSLVSLLLGGNLKSVPPIL